MRLLFHDSAGELRITRDLSDNQIPPYAILSHTWGADDEEVSLLDLSSPSYISKKGYQKIGFCGRWAQENRLQHFWVDTCCIDKSNSTELSKAIISMYRWYRNAQICYVYLADVSSSGREIDTDADGDALLNSQWKASFRSSRWFTRGWTLQELLAPREIIFYSKEGDPLGTKSDLIHLLHEITSIPESALRGEALSHFSVDERLRWAAARETKEPEDQVYCLLGIFDIYMPLMYGEGSNALRRLQKEIAYQYTVRPHERVDSPSLRYNNDDHRIRLRTCNRKQWTLSTTTLNFSFGRAVVYRSRSHAGSTRQQPSRANGSRINATFFPSSLFWQTRISLQAEWVTHVSSFALSSFSLQFLDVVQDDHALISASIRGDISALQGVLASREVSPLCSTTAGWTPLHYAAAYGHRAACKFLLAQGGPIRATGVRGVSPLHLAAHFGHLDVFKLLVEAGIDPDESHEHGLNAMFEMLSIGVGRASVNLTEFLQWLLYGQERFPLDMQVRDNSQRSILYHLANPPGRTNSRSNSLSVDQAHAIDFVLQEGVRGDELDFFGYSVLHEACLTDRIDLMKLLISRRCRLDRANSSGYTALQLAVEVSSLDLVSLLLETDADPNFVTPPDSNHYSTYGDKTPFEIAARFNRLPMVKLLLQHGAGQHDSHVSDAFDAALFHSAVDVCLYFLKHKRQQLDLHIAINVVTMVGQNRIFDMIRELHQAGAPLNSADTGGWTPLCFASCRGDSRLVKILVELGADLDRATKGQPENTPLRLAVDKGHIDIVSILLAAGARIEVLDQQTPTLIQLAINNGFGSIADLVASDQRGVSHDGTDMISSESNALAHSVAEDSDRGKRDLVAACFRGDLALVEDLLEQGSGFTARKGFRWFHLSIAIRHRHWHVVERLVLAGAELNLSLKFGHEMDDTPFVDAVRQNNISIIELMIAHGADVHIRTRNNATPLLRYLENSWSREDRQVTGKVVRALLNAGACVHAVDNYGRTALSMAARWGDLDSVIALVNAGADLDQLSPQHDRMTSVPSDRLIRRTPIAWAALGGHESIVRFLFDSGAEWRSLRQEPAVWYTHRLLLESSFPGHGDQASTTRLGASNSQSLKYGPDTKTKRPLTPVDDNIPLDSRFQPIEDDWVDLGDMKAKLFNSTRTLYALVWRVHERVQSFRLEVAALACVLLLLTARHVLRYLISRRLEDMKLMSLAVLAGMLIMCRSNMASELPPQVNDGV